MIAEWWSWFYLIPDWIPEGFSASEIPVQMISYEETIGMWRNEAQEKIRLFVVSRHGGMHPYAPAGMHKEVQVNGEPAILICGRFAPTSPDRPSTSRQWDETLGYQLSWSLEDAVYTLETFGPYISAEDLIRMAESMKTATAWTPAPP